jgi:hypothetical protein
VREPPREVARPAPRDQATDPRSDARPDRDAQDETQIREIVASYGRAIEKKDLALFRAIKPNLSAPEQRRLQDGFRAVTSQRVTLTIRNIERTADRAVVTVGRRDVIQAGGREYTSDGQQVLTLTRSPVGWVIVDIR